MLLPRYTLLKPFPPRFSVVRRLTEICEICNAQFYDFPQTEIMVADQWQKFDSKSGPVQVPKHDMITTVVTSHDALTMRVEKGGAQVSLTLSKN